MGSWDKKRVREEEMGKMEEEKEKQRKEVRESREMTTRDRKKSEAGSGRK